ncbi:MAG TPA: hypothetical protein VNQ79_12675 [Blastocatellia bacterium]|nr:hypothetical protein [Blastocatellia bacterium]
MIVFLFAIAAWYFLVRPVPEQTTVATIISRTFQPAEKVEKKIPRTSRSFEEPPREISYSLPDRYLFRFRMDDGTEAGFTAPALGMENVQAGQRVRVVYLERRIPFFGRRIFVKEMKLLSD